MQEIFLGRLVARDELSALVHLGQRRGIQTSETRVGRCHQPAIAYPCADIARAAEREPAIEQRPAEGADLLTQPGLAHGCTRNALVKKSVVPKLPDLSASARVGLPMLKVHGTPGSISGPIYRPRTPSALTTAPAVSPPATTRRCTPASTKPRAMRPSACSTSSPACSRPSRLWMEAT